MSARVVLLAAMALALSSLAAVEAEAEELGVGIAPFEAGTASEGLRLADDLARKLARYPLRSVVGPAELGAAQEAAPEGRSIRKWAEQAEVDAIVVGRVFEPEGGAASAIAVEVRSANSGGSLAAYRASLAEAGEAEALDTLARSIALGLGVEPETLPPVGALSPPEGGLPDEPVSSSLQLKGLRKDEPISIQSEELEVVSGAEGRTVIFTRDVSVSQGDVNLRADRLEAVYRKGESQPDRLVADGSVRVVQAEKRARCDHAVYLRDEQRITCTGRAQLAQSCDVVRGEEIRFDLDNESVKVLGAASVEMDPECEAALQ